MYNPPPNPDPSIASSHYGLKTVGVSVATAALASYAAMAGLDEGRPWTDVLTVGAIAGHTALLLDSDDRTGGEEDWAVALNAAGVVVGVGLELVRLLGRGDATSADTGAQAYVLPGRNGMELGVVLRR